MPRTGPRIDRHFCRRLSANLADSFSRDLENGGGYVEGQKTRVGWSKNRAGSTSTDIGSRRRLVLVLSPPSFFSLHPVDSFIS